MAGWSGAGLKGRWAAGPKSAVLSVTADPRVSMLADLDLLLIAVFCAADDLLPKRPGNARRRLIDAEVVSLCVAQAIIGIASDEHFVAVAIKRRVCPIFCVRSG